MIKATNITTNATVHLVVPEYNTKTMCDLIDEANKGGTPNEYTVFECGKMTLTDLPEEAQNQVKETLKVYAQVNVYFEYNKFEVSAHSCVKAKYNYDHFWCATFLAEDIYTEEERKQHLAELNSYEFPEWAW